MSHQCPARCYFYWFLFFQSIALCSSSQYFGVKHRTPHGCRRTLTLGQWSLSPTSPFRKGSWCCLGSGFQWDPGDSCPWGWTPLSWVSFPNMWDSPSARLSCPEHAGGRWGMHCISPPHLAQGVRGQWTQKSACWCCCLIPVDVQAGRSVLQGWQVPQCMFATCPR
jgi:hypothetical protein